MEFLKDRYISVKNLYYTYHLQITRDRNETKYSNLPDFFQRKNQKDRLPIILRGARQVGKSFIIEKIGNEYFDSLVTCDFEFRPELVYCFDNLDPISICSKLEIAFKQRIIPGKTLLFLDEIQNCLAAIKSLRYFKEKLPSLHVIAAGSLLEFILHEEDFSK